jgi:hypothetical protein
MVVLVVHLAFLLTECRPPHCSYIQFESSSNCGLVCGLAFKYTQTIRAHTHARARVRDPCHVSRFDVLLGLLPNKDRAGGQQRRHFLWKEAPLRTPECAATLSCEQHLNKLLLGVCVKSIETNNCFKLKLSHIISLWVQNWRLLQSLNDEEICYPSNIRQCFNHHIRSRLTQLVGEKWVLK